MDTLSNMLNGIKNANRALRESVLVPQSKLSLAIAEKLSKEGELGRRKITQWTRYVTVLLGVVQSFFIALTCWSC